MQFSQIPGLEDLKHQLIHSFHRSKVAHAQLFSGNPGSATFPMALAYATYLMCENRTEEDSCGSCPNCVRIQKSIHPDVHWYFPKVSASDRGKYDKVLAEALPIWRNFTLQSPFGTFEDWANAYNQENKNLQLSREDSRQILKNVSMRSVEGGYKIIFIWGAELMHPAGANAILKVLEEPPEKTLYLLISYNYESLLQTIRSRTQLVSIPPNSDSEVEQYLIQNHEVNPERAKQISSVAQGRIGSAINLMQGDQEIAHDQFREWMLACWNRNYTSLVKASEDFAKSGKASQKGFLAFSLSLIRSAVMKSAGNQSSSLDEKEEQFISRYAEKLGVSKLQDMYQLLNESLQNLERNSNPRITHLNLSLAIMKRLNA